MKKTKQHMEEARKVYDLFWDSYQAGDIDDFASTLDEKFEMIGTSESEICHSKEEGIEFYKGQLEEVVGKAEMRNRQINEIPLNEQVLINELCDIYTLLNSEWSFYSKIRISTLLHETPSGWKVIQQHGSLPDMRVQEGETLAIEKITKENIELRDAVKRRTAELENKNRELKIEAALERVRARTMVMHSTNELTEVVAVIFEELRRVGFDNTLCSIGIYNKDTKGADWWSFIEGGELPGSYHFPYLEGRWFKEVYEAWIQKKPYHYIELSGEEKKLQDKLTYEQTEWSNLPDKVKKALMEMSDHIKASYVSMNCGMLEVVTERPLTEEEILLLQRFTSVVDLTYTRVDDLQKAEAQAREAQIEAALERVRARSMAMHQSNEMQQVANEVYEQMKELGLQMDAVGMSGQIDAHTDYEVWIGGSDFDAPLQIPYTESTQVQRDYNEVIENRPELFTNTYSGKINKEYIGFLLDQNEFPEELKKRMIESESFSTSITFCDNSSIQIATYSDRAYTDKENEILKRFGKVFEQAYIRFMDLKKAEEQAREAEIEAALERVRARSMGMHHSTELIEVVRLLDREIKGLGIQNVDATQIATDLSDPDEGVNIWIKVEEMNYLKKFHAPYIDHPSITKLFKASRKKENFYTEKYSKAEKNRLFRLLFKYSDFRSIPEERKEVLLNSPGLVRSTVIHKNSALIFQHNGLDEFSEEHNAIFKRFGVVFEQTYTRFLDLQKAEEQAREAQIEAALERVRSRSMGMQRSDELLEIASLLYKEFRDLGVTSFDGATSFANCGYVEIDTEKGIQIGWMCQLDGSEGDKFKLPLQGDPILKERFNAWKNKATVFHQVVGGDDLISHINYATPTMESKVMETLTKNEFPDPTIFYCGNFQYGYLHIVTGTLLTEDEEKLFARFTRVFEQAYTRFQDIKRAEKLALETARQSSLDRIRAEIASMRSSEDLQQITPLIWDELNTLEIPFIRCGVFIIDEENGFSHTYLSTPQGESIAVMHLPLEGITQTENIYAFWQKQKIYTEHWDEEDFRDWTQNLIDRGFIESKKKYEAGSAPDTLDLYFLPFKHGMLYIGNTEPLSQEKLDLGQSMAKAFSVAYDRYEDFNKLDQAKQKIEEAFKELEAAKDQLVQQEKLASLGQLTAGIAHEIKNPLNFVNNFSDLSAELIQEARDEIESVRAYRDTPLPDDAMDEISAILDDIETNLKTIHKHGTRADGIVKSMLQHSRGGDGKMEPTPLNPLIKEYVNLAFHGMRAGKDPIDVEIELDLNENVGEVQMIGEDFSRVILNLCNNAFDAMREKANDQYETPDSPFEGGKDGVAGQGDGPSGEYEPKLTVRTRQKNDTVTIKIQDNGPGIPDDTKDKILQPFFTTKKGTAGTGLGLSITNDIIKAHGGTLKINSNGIEGTVFSIDIPKKGL